MIRAGRSRGGQPKSSAAGGPASSVGPDTAQPGTGSTPPDAAAADGAADSAADGKTAARQAAAGPASDDTAAEQPDGGGPQAGTRRSGNTTWARHLVLLLVYEAAGIAATWPRFTYLADHKLPGTQDVASYVWDIWWVTHQLVHLGNPFFTRSMAAPAGTQLGFSTLMPLAGWLMAPITVLYGPSASFTLLTIVTPGLLCYVMYRAARLWLNVPGAIVAGAFFGLSSMLLWQNWYHINVAMGTIFLPITLEAAVRLRRKPGIAPAVFLGLALGASILINQESTVVAVAIAAVILIPWIGGKLIKDRATLRPAIWPLAIGALVGIVVASPQLIAMLQQVLAGGASPPAGQLAQNYTWYGATLPTLFAPSPRLADFGLGGLASAYSFNQPLEGLPTFGVVLSALALAGLAVGWRRRSTWWFLALWLVSAVLSLGTSLIFGSNCTDSVNRPGIQYGKTCHQYLPLLTHLHGLAVNGVWQRVVVSNLMPYTWLVRIPGLAGLREADRFALVGLIGAAMLAGLAVQWLSQRTKTMPLIAVVVALGVLEAGWSGTGGPVTMPTALPRLDHFLIRDHTKSLVVDLPFGLRGGLPLVGSRIPPLALLLATHDEHPRAISYTAWVSGATISAIERHPFYAQLIDVQNGTPFTAFSKAQLQAARADVLAMHIGWIVEWRNIWTENDPGLRYSNVDAYLKQVGLRHRRSVCLTGPKTGCLAADQAWLYRPEPGSQHRQAK